MAANAVIAVGSERTYKEVLAEYEETLAAQADAEQKALYRSSLSDVAKNRAARLRRFAAEMKEEADISRAKAEAHKRKGAEAQNEADAKRRKLDDLKHERFGHSYARGLRLSGAAQAVRSMYAAAALKECPNALAAHLNAAGAVLEDVPRLLHEYLRTHNIAMEFRLMTSRGTSGLTDTTIRRVVHIVLHSPLRDIYVTHTLVSGTGPGGKFTPSSLISVHVGEEKVFSADVYYVATLTVPAGVPDCVVSPALEQVPEKTRELIPTSLDPSSEHARFLALLLLGFPYFSLLPDGGLKEAIESCPMLALCHAAHLDIALDTPK